VALLAVACSLVLGIQGLQLQQARTTARVAAAPAPAAGFVPVQGRLLDTRSTSALTSRSWRTVHVAGRAGIPSSGVSAVQLSVSAVAPATVGNVYLSRDVAPPQAQLVLDYGYDSGSFTNTAIVGLTPSGDIQVMATTGIDVVIDVQGYYASGAAAAGYVPIAPVRVYNTNAGQAPRPAGSTTTIPIGQGAGVPAGAAAVFANVTISDFASASGYATAYASDAVRPTAALNYPLGAATSFGTTVPLGGDGSIKLYVSAGPVDVIVDVVGYFTDRAAGGTFTPAQGRVATKVLVAPKDTVQVQVAGVSGVPDAGAGVAAVAMDVQTSQAAASWGSLIVWASGSARPNTTSVDLTEAAVVSNFVTSAVGADDMVDVFNGSADPVYVWVDLEGWYGPAADATLVQGTITGTSPVAGADVTLTAWPSTRTLAAQAEGDTVPTLALDATTSDSSGDYTLSADLSRLPAAYVEDGGAVSLQVDVAAAGVSQTYNLSAAVPGSVAAAAADDVAVAGAPDRLDFDLANSTVTDAARDAVAVSNDDDPAAAMPVDFSPTFTTPSAAATDTGPSVSDNPASLPPPPGPNYPCGYWTKVGTYLNRPEHFMDAYAWTGAPATVVETSTSSHSLGIDVSLNGKAWSLAGSVSADTRESNESGRTVSAGTRMYNGVNYLKYSQLCRYHDRAGKVHWYTDSEMRPGGFFDLTEGQFERPVADPDFAYCDVVYPGDRKTKSRGTNVTYSSGVSIVGVVSTSAHASFAQDTSITWNITAKSLFCGSTSAGPLRAPQADVRAYGQTGPGRCGSSGDAAVDEPVGTDDVTNC
jgi:hypothetical protein